MNLVTTAIGFITGGSWTRLAVTILAGIAIGGCSAWQIQAWRAAGAELQRETDAREQHTANERTAHTASTSYQKESAHERIVYRDRVKVVQQIVDRPVYRGTCIDADGLQQINDAIDHQPATP